MQRGQGYPRLVAHRRDDDGLGAGEAQPVAGAQEVVARIALLREPHLALRHLDHDPRRLLEAQDAVLLQPQRAHQYIPIRDAASRSSRYWRSTSTRSARCAFWESRPMSRSVRESSRARISRSARACWTRWIASQPFRIHRPSNFLICFSMRVESRLAG